MKREAPTTWAERSLNEVIETITGGTSVNCEDRPRRPSEKGMLKLGAVSSGAFRPEEHKAAVGSDAALLNVPVQHDTVLFVRKNTPELVGRAAYIEADHDGLFLPDLIWELRPKPGVSARWLSYWFQSPAFQALVPALAAGSSQSMVGINQGSLLRSLVLVPPFEDQCRIVAALEKWDEAINRTERLIAAKRVRRREALRLAVFGRQADRRNIQLAFKQLESSNHWPIKVIGDFAWEVSTLNKGAATLPVLSCTKHDGLVFSNDYFGGRKIHSEDTSQYKVVKRGQFVYATNHLEEGSIGLQSLADVGLVSPMYTVFDVDEAIIDRRFAIAILKTENYRQAFERSTSSSVDRRGGLRWSEFATLPFPVPSLDVQKRIAAAVEALDEELSAEDARLRALGLQKRSLMQKLLTGDQRLGENSAGVAA